MSAGEGLLFHVREGDAWLAAGGRFPGLTREQAVAEVKSWGAPQRDEGRVA